MKRFPLFANRSQRCRFGCTNRSYIYSPESGLFNHDNRAALAVQFKFSSRFVSSDRVDIRGWVIIGIDLDADVSNSQNGWHLMSLPET